MQYTGRTIISRIQNRRGLRQNLPQPLRPGEIALTSDTRQVWIGNEDIAPYGIRTYDRSLNTIDLVNPLLESQMVILNFDSEFDTGEFELLQDWFSAENVRLFPPAVPGNPNPAINYNQTLQLLQTNGSQAWFGLRPQELAYAGLVEPLWLTDPAAAIAAVVSADYPSGLPVLQSAITADQAFPVDTGTSKPDWLGQPGLFRVLLFDDVQYQQDAAGAAARLINLCGNNTATPSEYVTTLGNIEIGTIEEFEQVVVVPPDTLFDNPFVADLADTGGATATTGFEFNTSISDSVILDYALSTATEAAVGTLKISVYDGTAVAFDDRVESADDFDVFLTATESAGTLIIQYSNDISETVRLSFVVRRWNSTT